MSERTTPEQAGSEPTRGYLTMAAGSPRFLEMAVDMALSLREHTTLPVALAADEPIAEIVSQTYPTVFDHVGIVPQEFRDGRGLKYGVAEATPFDQTAFIDADCIVLGSLEHVWDALEGHDMAFLGELLTEDDDENHHGFSTRRLMRRFGLRHYLKTNSGFFCFRREPAREILRECLTCYVEEARPRLRWSLLLGAWLGDEIAIGIVGGRRRLGTLPKPAEMYWPNEFASIDLREPPRPLLHFIWPVPETVLGPLMDQVAARRRAAGIPDPGPAHWLHEQMKLERMARRRRMLERFRIW